MKNLFKNLLGNNKKNKEVTTQEPVEKSLSDKYPNSSWNKQKQASDIFNQYSNKK